MEFTIDRLNLFRKYNPDTLKIRPQFDVFLLWTGREEASYKWVIKSYETELKAEADYTRDRTLTGFSEGVTFSLRAAGGRDRPAFASALAAYDYQIPFRPVSQDAVYRHHPQPVCPAIHGARESLHAATRGRPCHLDAPRHPVVCGLEHRRTAERDYGNGRRHSHAFISGTVATLRRGGRCK